MAKIPPGGGGSTAIPRSISLGIKLADNIRNLNN